MNFKVGEKVRVKRNLREMPRFIGGYMPDMQKLEGKIVTIRTVSDDTVTIEEYKYVWDKNAFEKLSVKPTKEELFKMPNGTIITTNAKDSDYEKWIKKDEDTFINLYDSDEGIDDYDVNSDLTLSLSDKDYGTEIVKIEKPQYTTVYDYSKEVKEMTVAEIEKELGHAVKIIKEED